LYHGLRATSVLLEIPRRQLTWGQCQLTHPTVFAQRCYYTYLHTYIYIYIHKYRHPHIIFVSFNFFRNQRLKKTPDTDFCEIEEFLRFWSVTLDRPFKILKIYFQIRNQQPEKPSDTNFQNNRFDTNKCDTKD
jgi:hypothetical protein